jgi:hybrid cluster-associated redox disulfide protein
LRRRKDVTASSGYIDRMSQRVRQIDEEMTVDEVMQCWPATIRVFLDFRMSCIGCPIACFHTVGDAAREHGIEIRMFLAALWATASRA